VFQQHKKTLGLFPSEYTKVVVVERVSEATDADYQGIIDYHRHSHQSGLEVIIACYGEHDRCEYRVRYSTHL